MNKEESMPSEDELNSGSQLGDLVTSFNEELTKLDYKEVEITSIMLKNKKSNLILGLCLRWRNGKWVLEKC